MPNLFVRLSEAVRAREAVHELMKSKLLSPSTKFYLGQLSEVLQTEIAEPQKQVDQAVIA